MVDNLPRDDGAWTRGASRAIYPAVVTKMDPSRIMKEAIAWFGLRPFPISLAYEMSWLCNLECGYCDRHTPMERELNREQIFAALGEFAALGLRDVSLDGGEPLAHRNVDEVVQWLVERRIEVTMHTNAILLPRKIATVRKLTKVKISLDGPAEQHDAVHGKGSFASAIARSASRARRGHQGRIHLCDHPAQR